MKTNKINRQEIISKRHITMVKKFNDELMAFAKETGEDAAELYEDAFTSFTLANVRVEDGYLKYEYDGREDKEDMVAYDEEENTYYEIEGLDDIPDFIKFWRSCLRKAKRYWSMDTETLDKIQEGEIEDTEMED